MNEAKEFKLALGLLGHIKRQFSGMTTSSATASLNMTQAVLLLESGANREQIIDLVSGAIDRVLTNITDEEIEIIRQGPGLGMSKDLIRDPTVEEYSDRVKAKFEAQVRTHQEDLAKQASMVEARHRELVAAAILPVMVGTDASGVITNAEFRELATRGALQWADMLIKAARGEG